MASQFGSYTLLKEVSRGATCVVYRARNQRGDDVALKVMAPDLVRDPQARQRFLVESKKQPVHPHIVRIFEANEYEGVPYIAMEFIDGPSLANRIVLAKSAGTTIPLAEVDLILGHIASALDAAHKKGIVHRDIKPGNILIRSKDQSAMLMDFGLAQGTVSGVSSGLTAIVPSGTVDYVSPEQINGGKVGPAADIYSLGVTVFHALAGRLPFEADESIVQLYKHLNEIPPILSSINPRVPQGVSEVVMRTLDKNPALRYKSASDFASAFHQAVSGKKPTSAQLPVFAIAGGIAFVLLVTAGFILSRGRPEPTVKITAVPIVSTTPALRRATPTAANLVIVTEEAIVETIEPTDTDLQPQATALSSRWCPRSTARRRPPRER